jgi:hypothetical protein
MTVMAAASREDLLGIGGPTVPGRFENNLPSLGVQ